VNAGDYPLLYQVEQRFDRERVEDIPAAVRSELAALNLSSRCQSGQTIALTVGSRGIANLPAIVRATADTLKTLGLKPFIVPAMGSHGGATPEGQKHVLEEYGVTEKTVGVPIRSCLDVVPLGTTEDGVPVVIDRLAHEADWIGVINRIKPHTRFIGEIESGLAKMILIGLGKAEGARIYHRAEVVHSFGRLVRTAVPLALRQARILFGLGIIENGHDETARLAGVAPARLLEVEPELLRDAIRRMPKLPFREFDVVVIDQMGKNFSGVGIDTNIVGAKSGATIRRIYVRDLHPSSGGNAIGVGQVDLIHRRLAEKIDPKVTRVNCVTSLNLAAARVPMTFDTDREALEAALTTIGLTPPQEARLCWIPNTLELHEVWISQSLIGQARERPDLTVRAGPCPIQFDKNGDFVPCPGMFSMAATVPNRLDPAEQVAP
jgi:hypothetical protein